MSKVEEENALIRDCVTDIYAIRRKLERKFGQSHEKQTAIDKLDEATFWIKSIPIVME